MGILTKGDNVLFINQPDKTPLLFTQQAADLSTNPNASTQDGTTGNVMHIQGLAARVKLGALTGEVRATRPQPGVNQVITIDPADATQIKISGTAVVGRAIHFSILLDVIFGSPVEFYRANPGERSQYGRTNFFPIKYRQGDTETTLLTRLAAAINDIPTQDYGEYPYKADFGVTNAGKFTLTSKNTDWQLDMQAYDTQGVDAPSTQLSAFNPFTAVAANKGLSTYETLQATYRLQTESRNEPYSLQQWDAPLQGGLYTNVVFKTVTPRPDLVSTELADSPVNGSENTFTLYILNGPNGEAYLTKLLNFLNRAGAAVTKSFVKRDNTVLAVPGAAGSAGTFLADV